METYKGELPKSLRVKKTTQQVIDDIDKYKQMYQEQYGKQYEKGNINNSISNNTYNIWFINKVTTFKIVSD